MKKRSNSRFFIPIVLFLLSLGAFWIAFQRPSGRGSHDFSSVSPYSSEVEHRVNQHLFLTSQQLELRSQNVEAQNEFTAPHIGQALIPPKQTRSLDFSPDANEQRVLEELNLNKKTLNYTSPNNVIQGQLFDQDHMTDYENEYRKKYAEQFLENARRHGYAIRLSPDYKVIGIEAIKVPEKKSGPVIDPGGQGAQ